jgi:hypothetical protein
VEEEAREEKGAEEKGKGGPTHSCSASSACLRWSFRQRSGEGKEKGRNTSAAAHLPISEREGEARAKKGEKREELGKEGLKQREREREGKREREGSESPEGKRECEGSESPEE